MTYDWEKDAKSPEDYNKVEVNRGREFILRLTTGADVVKALEEFAREQGLRFAKVNTSFMGGLQPARLLIWAPDTENPENWHNEEPMAIENLSMVLSMNGIIHPRPAKGEGKEEEPCAAIHTVLGGGWDVPTQGGHLLEGSRVKGVVELFVTEVKGIDVLYPEESQPEEDFPENWYEEKTK